MQTQTSSTEATLPGKAARIIVIDDEATMRSLVTDILAPDGHEIIEYDPAAAAPETLAQHFDVAVIDIVMPHLDGFAMYEKVLCHSPSCQCVMMTGFPDADKVNQSVDSGIYSFLVKPFSAVQLRMAVQGALKKRTMTSDCAAPRQSHLCSEPTLTGESAHVRSTRAHIAQLAPLDIPVLIVGESGTGKEVAARSIHRLSSRGAKTFMAVNCAVLPPSLIESELFGHARGAFTGASKTKFGYFEVAHNGTLFLDEIGELPLDLQSKLLRVLDNGEFMRVGETQVRRTDVRVISATNRDLDAMRREGRFRDDLYYRLKGGRIALEPLRNRREDILPLAGEFLGENAGISPTARAMLMRYDWPGNTRELRMICASLKGRRQGKMITDQAVIEALGLTETALPPITPYQELKTEMLRKFDRDYFSTVLEAADGNMTRAARFAAMDRKNLREKIKVSGLHTL